MTRYETVSILVSALGLASVIVSLWFLRGQVKLMREQTRRLNETLELSAESTLDSLFIFITQAYMDHPKLRSVFNESEGPTRFEDLTDDDKLRANALAESLLDAMERSLRLHRQGVSSPGLLVPWIEGSLRGSRFLREWLRMHAGWYQPELLSLIPEDGDVVSAHASTDAESRRRDSSTSHGVR